MRHITAHEILPNDTAVQLLCGSGRRGIVIDCSPAQSRNTAAVHTVLITHKHNGQSGKCGKWIANDNADKWIGNYTFVMDMTE